jgi:hypothetical protein
MKNYLYNALFVRLPYKRCSEANRILHDGFAYLIENQGFILLAYSLLVEGSNVISKQYAPGSLAGCLF